jgi:porphobilinogen synthase
MIAPSDMMDGRIMWLRQALDDEGYDDTLIMAYSAKYASSLYAPFREAAHSTPSFGDRRTYQMDPRNKREALEELMLDVQEGADILMIKPAMFYQDVVASARLLFNHPLAVYCVSGEYSMIKAASQNEWIDEQSVVLEQLTGLIRSGADIIITYHALDVARWLR